MIQKWLISRTPVDVAYPAHPLHWMIPTAPPMVEPIDIEAAERAHIAGDLPHTIECRRARWYAARMRRRADSDGAGDELRAAAVKARDAYTSARMACVRADR